MALPKFLYALQNSPNPVPIAYFKSIEAEVNLLLWEGKPPRIAMSKLTRSWYDGGFALPNVQLYYWAAHLIVENQWLHAPQEEPSIRLDRHVLGADRLLSSLYNKAKTTTLTGPTAHTLHIWYTAQRTLGWKGILTQHTPLWDSPKLGMLRNSKGFAQWDLIGISKVGDLWKKGETVTFSQLRTTYQMADSEQFRYLQIKHAVTRAIPHGTNLPESSPLEDRLLTDHLTRKAISLTYRKLINNQKDPTHALREKWQTELGDMDNQDWQEALASPREAAIPSRLRLVQLKILHRTYYTRTTLHKIGRSETPLCLRGCGQMGTLSHTVGMSPNSTILGGGHGNNYPGLWFGGPSRTTKVSPKCLGANQP